MSTPTSSVDEQPVSLLDDEDLWSRIRSEYLKETPTRDPELASEIKCVQQAMRGLTQPNLARYIVVDLLGVGGTGIVFNIWDQNLRTNRALKLARPIEGKEELIIGLVEDEISRLQEVSHPNVISIFDAGRLPCAAGDLPFYTMTFLRGALPAQKYFAKERDISELLEFLDGFLSGVTHLHKSSLLHLDIKPNNVFVADGGYAVVADLGGARRVDGDLEERIRVTCTTAYAHPKLLGITQVSSTGGDDNRRRGRPKRSELCFAFDLYAVGKTIFEVVAVFEKAAPKGLDTYTRKYTTLQAARLLDGLTGDLERPLGLTKESLDALKYTTAAEASLDLAKLVGRVNLLSVIPELSPTNDRVIQVTRGEKTNLTARLADLLKEPLLRRLGTVSQLGFVRLVYPSATHTRLEHSLGAFSNAAQYITALYNDPINPLFKQIIREEDLVATLLAALLHDLGQYQHAHDLAEVEGAVFKHETLTAALLNDLYPAFQVLTSTLQLRIERDWHVTPKRILEILEAKPEKVTTDIRDRLLHTIISGPLDVDKLDYLIRDSVHCQTVFARGIDRSRLLATLTVVYEIRRAGESAHQYFALGIHEKGRAAAESFAFTRFQMFRAVYWHHAVRSAKAMLHRAAYEWIAPDRRDPRTHDALKHELYEFVLEQSPDDRRGGEAQPELFGEAKPKAIIGDAVRPQWSTLNHADLSALEWLHGRTTETGKRLVEMLATRKLYKRVLVASAGKEKELWERIQADVTNHERLRERSEALRKALKTKVDEVIKKAEEQKQPFLITGLGEIQDGIATAAAVLGLPGTVLIDVPKGRSGEVLRYYAEEQHRGQREEFGESPSLASSELWNLLSARLHESAGNIRVFVHPDVDILRKARVGSSRLSLFPIAEELRTMFGLE